MSDEHDPAKMEAELRRLRAGKFNSEEIPSVARGIPGETWLQLERLYNDWSSKLHGFARPANEEERRLLKLHYAGLTSCCCECCEGYPRGDHMIDGEIFCAKCREEEKARTERRKS